MRLVFVGTVRRVVGFAALFFVALPFGLSVTGCGHHSTPVQYCSAGDSGPVVGQVASIVLAPNFATAGESLNYGQMGSQLSATAYDCKGSTVSVKGYTFASTSSFNVNQTGGPIFADINPTSGQVCGGTWNRNTGGGVPNYTTCTPPSVPPAAYLAYVTATAQGTVSNAIPVYVHPVVTGIVLGTATPKQNCPTATSPGFDPGTDCSTTCSPPTTGTVVTANPYDGTSCLSQGQTGQLIARVYAGGNTNPANNITCKVGHITFATQTGNIASIDQNGVATAQQPGSTVVTATVSNSSSAATTAGFLSTCPPASITLAAPGFPAGTNSINVSLNNQQPLTATVLDTNGNVITGLGVEFNSTTPQTIPPSNGSVTPLYPGSANITAVCLPSVCNPAPFSQIGLFGNGKAITSNPITVTAAGTSSTVIYMASTQSQYVAYRDFTTNQPSTLIKLPYVPNSMVITQTGTAVYMGSEQGLMTFTTANNLLGTTNQSITGLVLSVSPDSSTLVVTDPVRQTITLVTGGGTSVSTTWGGIATHVGWSPDSQTVYITTTTGLVLQHSTYTDWQTANADEVYSDVAVTAPSVGAYFAGPSSTEGRSYCPASTVAGTGNPPVVTNEFIPVVDNSAAITDRIGTTTDGNHVLGAHATAAGAVTLSDIDTVLPENATPPVGACPIPPAPQPAPGFFKSSYTTDPLPGISALPLPAAVNAPGTTVASTAITGVIPSSNSAAAFVLYNGTTTVGQNPLLPFYAVPATGKGTVTMVPLGSDATTNSSPVAGAFSTDTFSFYAGTEGAAGDTTSADNDVHIIALTYPAGSAPTAVDSGVIQPNLPLATGTGYAPVNLLVQKPKKSTD